MEAAFDFKGSGDSRIHALKAPSSSHNFPGLPLNSYMELRENLSTWWRKVFCCCCFTIVPRPDWAMGPDLLCFAKNSPHHVEVGGTAHVNRFVFPELEGSGFCACLPPQFLPMARPLPNFLRVTGPPLPGPHFLAAS